jgi:Probable sensor domain DACNV
LKNQTYPAADLVAPRLQALFAEHVVEARRRGHHPLATVPDAGAIGAMIGAAFWASLRREEGYQTKISLAFAAPHETIHPLLFERPLRLDPAALTRVAPAVERAGIHLGVWRTDGSTDDDLWVWGTTRAIPITCFVLEVAAPGLLVVKHHRGEESGKFVNVAVLEGDEVKIVDEHAASLPDCPALLTSMLGFDSPASWADNSLNILVQLAVSMRSHGRGGLLLVVPGGDSWRESIARPIPYAIDPPYEGLAELVREAPVGRRRQDWQDALARVVSGVAGLTAVDGAALLSTSYEVLAFGAKIVRRKGSPQIEQVTVTEPIEGAGATLVDPTQLGGTRHLSAAQFVHDQRDAIALVASQDGRFTVFAWSPCEATVHAHRVEALLL